MSKKKYTYICVCNDALSIEKHISPDEFDDYVKMGYRKGKLQKTKDNISVSKKGVPQTDIAKLHMKEAQNRPEVRDNKKNKCSGWHHTESAKDKIHKTHKGRKHSEEHNRKVSESLTGRKVSEEAKQNMRHPKRKLTYEENQAKQDKTYKTKKKNKSFNTSTPEKEYHKKLLTENVGKTVLTQYKDKERYPYYCDFYIVEDDLFIELNAHWTHGPAPFDENNPEHIELLNQWKEKAKQSKFYENAIITWTIRDVEKKKTAEKNGLNYITIY